MAINNCSPTDIFGSVEQTMFLGCSVRSFDLSLGWNSQVSNLTVNLVHDPCPGTKVYYDPSLSTPKQTWTDNGKDYDGNTVSGADPGFYSFGLNHNEPPEVGAPVYFRVDDFEFCGLLQSYTENYSTGGHHLYSVTISDPRTILEGTQVIIGDYVGTVGHSYNLFNVLGFWDSLGDVACPEFIQASVDGAMSGSITGAYGGVSRSNNGMLWTQIRDGISLLSSAFPKTNSAYSSYGRIVYRGAARGGTGLLPYDGQDLQFGVWFNLPSYLAEYYVDLSTLPTMPSDFRISGTSVNVLDLISQVCGEAAHDFYIELVPVRTGGRIVKMIKVRSVSRATQPDLNAITTYIDSLPAGTKIEYSRGRELRNESTSKFIIGGQKQTIWQAEDNEDPSYEPNTCIEAYSSYSMYDDILSPFWGVHADQSVILTNVNADSWWEFTVSTDFIKGDLKTLSTTDYDDLPDSVVIDEREILACLNSFTSWQAYSVLKPTEIGTICDLGTAILTGNPIVPNFPKAARNFLVLNRNIPIMTTSIQDAFQAIYDFVKIFADRYGKYFMVRLPYTCGTLDDQGELITTEYPSDGGWTEDEYISGLYSGWNGIEKFKILDGRIGPFIRYGLISRTEEASFTGSGSAIYKAAEIEPDFVYANPSTLCSPRAVIKIIDDKYENDNNSTTVTQQLTLTFKQIYNTAIGDLTAFESLYEGGHVRATIPSAAAVPLISTVNTYGPWKTNTIAERGPPGQREIVVDSELVPWEFAGYTRMNAYAQNIANGSVNNMQVGEMGSFSIVGLPDIPLGAELGAVTGLGGTSAYTNGEHLIENRTVKINHNSTASAAYYSTNANVWTGIYGPNITGINVSYSDTGFKTSYQMRTFTPTFGRFNKLNADRIAAQTENARYQQMMIKNMNEKRYFNNKDNFYGKYTI